MRPVSITQTGTGATAAVPMDWRADPFNVGIGCVLNGTVAATFSVQHAFELPPVNWFNNANVINATGNIDTNYNFPVRAIRGTISAGAGSVTFNIIQSGPT